MFSTLDPVELLNRIREAQRTSTPWRRRRERNNPQRRSSRLKGFVASLSTAWRDGEVRPTHRKPSTGPRTWRTRVDPFQDVWPLIEQWLNEKPDATAKELFQRLQGQTPTPFTPGQLRTLQRRVKEWRTTIARHLVLGVNDRAEVFTSVCNSDPCA